MNVNVSKISKRRAALSNRIIMNMNIKAKHGEC